MDKEKQQVIESPVEEVLNEVNSENIKALYNILEILNKPYTEQTDIAGFQIPASSNEKYQTFCGT